MGFYNKGGILKIPSKSKKFAKIPQESSGEDPFPSQPREALHSLHISAFSGKFCPKMADLTGNSAIFGNLKFIIDYIGHNKPDKPETTFAIFVLKFSEIS